MKLLLSITILLSSLALANQCKADCRDVQKECENQCNKVVKKSNASQVPACMAQCKEFTRECEKECDDDAKGGR
jgi:hypothetical protein